MATIRVRRLAIMVIIMATKVTMVQGNKSLRNRKDHLLPVDGVVTRLIFHINVLRKMTRSGNHIPVLTVKVKDTQHPCVYPQSLIDYWKMSQLVA